MTKALLFKLNLQLFAEDDDDPGKDKPGDKKDPDDVDKNYLDEIKSLKEGKAKAEKDLAKAVAENKKLLKDYLDGDIPPADEKDKTEEPTEEELRESLYVKKDCKNNLEYFKKTLKLREKVMERGEIDPFVPVGKDMTPEQRHFDSATKIAKEIQSCIDACEDDPEQFNRLFDKKIIGGLPVPGRINR